MVSCEMDIEKVSKIYYSVLKKYKVSCESAWRNFVARQRDEQYAGFIMLHDVGI